MKNVLCRNNHNKRQPTEQERIARLEKGGGGGWKESPQPCPQTLHLLLHFSLNSPVDSQLGQDQKYAINAIMASITSVLGRQRLNSQEGVTESVAFF